MVQQLRQWARTLKRDITALYLAARDPRVPWYAKVVAACVAGYALSPIDLIPDFVPILGYLDDLILVPLGIMLAIRLIPAPVLSDLRATATSQLARRPTSWVGAIAIIGIWVACAALAARWFMSHYWG